MNNNAPQFNLGAMLGTPAPLQNNVQQIPCNMLIPYHNHKFELYSGERLEDMTESIKTNGVLVPILVQPCVGGNFEILSGHNRWNAAKLAGLPTVPAIVKNGLTEEEAEVYVIETNVMQRGFGNLKPSEQACVVAQRHSEMFSQGKRNDIIRELEMLSNEGNEEADSPLGTKSEKGDSKQAIAESYDLGRTSVARLLRINVLVDELKKLVDNGVVALRSGVELSYLSEDVQRTVAELITPLFEGETDRDVYKLDMKKAQNLRRKADRSGNISTDDIINILDGMAVRKRENKPKTVKINNDVYRRYFDSKTKPKEITATIEKALDFYFENYKGE